MNQATGTVSPTEVVVATCEFPLLPGKEQLCVSFQVRPIDAPEFFYERPHGDDAGERGVQAGNGTLFEKYVNVQFQIESIARFGLKLVDVYTKWKDTQKGPRGVVYFWFAPDSDQRNFRNPEFLAYAKSEFARMASETYVTGEAYSNPDGPPCIVMKGVAQCAPRTTLALVEGDMVAEDATEVPTESVAIDPAKQLLGIAMLGTVIDMTADGRLSTGGLGPQSFLD